ncbi:SIMPL domain-containing protein [Coprobacter sp.]
MDAKRFQLPIAGLLIAIGLYLLGWTLSHALLEIKDKDRIVTVKGLAEKEVSADKVIWPLAFKEIGNDMISMYDELNRKNQIIITFLKNNGITENEISLSAPQIIDMKAERYSNIQSPYRYNITSVITVTSGQIDRVRKLMDKQADLLKLGVAITGGEYQYSPQFFFTKLNEIKPGMIEEATKNARSSAEKFAKDSDSELGKIKRANQGQFIIEDRDVNTPYIKSVRVVTTVDYYLED